MGKRCFSYVPLWNLRSVADAGVSVGVSLSEMGVSCR